jgi:biotin operon repressor
MNKAERLFHLVTLLRSRRIAMTAEAIAETLGVSVRTVYRDVQALTLSGVPIDGESGVGYLLRPGHHLPPLMFPAAVCGRWRHDVCGSPLCRPTSRAATSMEHGNPGGKGAAAAQGAETELVHHLYDLHYKGCMSCFAWGSWDSSPTG